MDESAFHRARGAANPQPCVFEKALFARCCACSLVERQSIAEREVLACASPPAQAQCAALRALLRQKSVFALKLAQPDGPLPHANEMKLQCGGLQGLQRLAQGQAAAGPGVLPALADVHELVRVCSEKFGGLANLPYSEVVQSVVAFPIRRRRS